MSATTHDDPADVAGDAPGRVAATQAPETGDLVIDAALRELSLTAADDLDAQIVAGEQVQRTLQARLADLGG